MAGIRAGGLSLYGPPAAETLVKVPERIVREGYREWGESLAAEGEWLKEPPTVLAARVLNLIRCVHGWETGGLASKAEAAAWLGRQDRSLGGLARQAMEIRSATEGISPDELRWRFPELARWAKGRLRSGAS